MHNIQANLRLVKERITLLEQRFGRPYNSVCLLAVSKTHPTDAIRSAVDAGQRRFGESYLQQALPKIAELANCALEWHFIGPIQSNKQKVLQHALIGFTAWSESRSRSA
jgi:Predicted enzyme with a TIM-barrel fold